MINAALALQYLSIQRNAVSGAHHDAVSDDNLLYWKHNRFTIAAHNGLIRTQLHQCADGIARAVHGVSLQHVGDGKKK